MSKLTPQQINEKLAIEIMGWVKGESIGYAPAWYYKQTDTGKYHAVILIDDWNPWKVTDHAFMVLQEWLEAHPDHKPKLGVDWEGDDCYLFLEGRYLINQAVYSPSFIGHSPKYKWSQAICNCLMQAKEVKE